MSLITAACAMSFAWLSWLIICDMYESWMRRKYTALIKQTLLCVASLAIMTSAVIQIFR